MLLAVPAVVSLGPHPGRAAAASPVCPAARPDEPSAVAAARACGGRVEVLGARTERFRLLADKDGSRIAELSASVRRVHLRDGSWTAPDATLRRLPDGSLGPVASTADVRFSGDGSGPLVRWRDRGSDFTLSWPGPIGSPTVDGDTAVYRDVLPGVDLRLRATADGFGHVLVIRDRQAAGNPALREVRLRRGGTAAAGRTASGGLELRGADGSIMASASEAMMWDSAAGTGGAASAAGPADGSHRGRAGVALSGADVVITPGSWLTDPGVTFPAYVDPMYYGSGASSWAYADSGNATNSTDVARVGLSPDDGYRYRSLFQFPTSAGGYDFRGARIIDATFKARLYHSYSCTSTAVSLWRVDGIPATPRSTWGSFAMQKWLDTQYAHSHKGTSACGNEPDVDVYFRNNLTADVQTAASQGWTNYAVALSAMDSGGAGESTQDRWKKFYPTTAQLTVTYNHAPATPAASDLGTVPGTACTTAAPYARVNSTTGIQLQATLRDSDGNNVQGRWSVNGVDAQYAPPDTAWFASGTTVDTTVPAAAFTDGQTYSWQVQATDGEDASGWGPLCVFVVDNTAPAPPLATSKDLNLGPGGITPPPGPGAFTGVPAKVTLSPAPGDTDVHGYRFAVSLATATPTESVTADASGAATIPVVPVSWSGTNVLTIEAIDAAGSVSGTRAYRFAARQNTGAAHTQKDVTGDGKSDVVGVYDAGNGKVQIKRWDTTATGDAVFAPVTGPDIADYPPATTRWVSADVTGDGLADLVAWRSEANGRATLTLFTAKANSFQQGLPVDAGVSSWGTGLDLLAGDFDGDGHADVATLIEQGPCTAVLEVWAATPDGAGFAAAPTEAWRSTTGGWCRAQTKIVAGDVTGDGRTDLAAFYDYGNCTAGLWLFTATGSPGTIAFGSVDRTWMQSTAGNWCMSATTPTVTDVDGDGRADVTALYDYGNYTWRVWDFAGPGLTGAGVIGQNSSDSDASQLKPVTGDFNGDGHGDLGHFYNYGGGQTKLWLLYSTGSALGGETLTWDSGGGQLDWSRLTPL